MYLLGPFVRAGWLVVLTIVAALKLELSFSKAITTGAKALASNAAGGKRFRTTAERRGGHKPDGAMFPPFRRAVSFKDWER
jgi:hypothetical protein